MTNEEICEHFRDDTKMININKEAPKEKWICVKGMIYCAECSHSYDKCFIHDFNFCPSCGADMRGYVTEIEI